MNRSHLATLIALAGALFVVRFGYEYGAGDQEELLSLLLRHLDPTLFSRDAYVVEQGGQFSVRTPFVRLLGLLCAFLPMWAAVLVVYVVAWAGVAWGVVRLAEALGASPVVAGAAMLAALVGVPTWTLGGNALVSNLLSPEMMAWALALPAVRLAAVGRPAWAGVLLGVAAYLQLLVGVLVGGALGLALVLGAREGDAKARWREALGLGGAALLVAAPMLWGVLGYRAAGPPVPDDGLSTFFLIAELRLPHHYLPSEFGRGRWARFAVLALAGGVGLWRLRRVGSPMRFAERLLLAIALICFVALPCIELGEILLVAQLQTFKLTVLANALLVMAACAGAATLVPATAIGRRLHPGWTVGAAGLAVAIVGALLATGRLDHRIGPWARAGDPLTQIERWIAGSTPRDALVAVDPSQTTFRVAARRSVVASYKPMPFQDGAVHAWYARLQDLAPGADPDQARGLAFADELRRAYDQNDRADWERLRQTYGVTHVVRNLTGGEAPVGRAVFQAGKWAVYQIAPSDSARGGDEMSVSEVR